MLTSTADLMVGENALNASELNCLQMVAEGKLVPEISILLSVDLDKTESILIGAAEKLGAKNRLHAVSIALSRGFLAI